MKCDDKKTIVITGANGFIGRHLIETLDKDKYNIFAITRQKAPECNINPKYITLEVADYDRISQHILCCDVFIHLAWIGNKKELLDDEKTNRTSYEAGLAAINNLIEHSRCHRVILPGSYYEYGDTGCPIDENTPVEPVNAYGKYKLKLYEEASDLCDRKGVELAELRLFSVYGDDDSTDKFYNYCMSNMIRNNALSVSSCTQMHSFLHIDDLVDAIIAVIDYPGDISGVYNVSSDTHMQLKSFVRQMKDITGSKSRIQFGNNIASGKGRHRIMLSGNFQDKFDWFPRVLFSEGGKRTMEYYISRNDRGGVESSSYAASGCFEGLSYIRFGSIKNRICGGLAA